MSRKSPTLPLEATEPVQTARTSDLKKKTILDENENEEELIKHTDEDPLKGMTKVPDPPVESKPASPESTACEGSAPEKAKAESMERSEEEGKTEEGEGKVETKTILTEAMIEEEKKLQEETAKEEEKMRMERQKNARNHDRDMSYKRLQRLLQMSNSYTAYLGQRMQAQQEKEQERRQQLMKRNKKRDQDLNETSQENQEQPRIEVRKEVKKVEVKKEVKEVEEALFSPRRTLRTRDSNSALSSPACSQSSVTSEPSRSTPRTRKSLSAQSTPASSQSSAKIEPTSQKKRGRKRKAESQSPQSSPGQQLILADYFKIAEATNKRQKLEEGASQENGSPPDNQEVQAEEKEIKKEETVVETKVRVINGETVPMEQPNFFEGGVLRSYQIEGFNWLRVLYENGINGILADEMGLGKTIQCIACICNLVEFGVPGPFLVCAPLSTVPNWVGEFERFAPKVPVILYHGNLGEREVLRKKVNRLHRVSGNISVFPVVVTSYEIAMKDRKHIGRFPWKYLILDEGHRIKNFQCQLVRDLKKYRSTHRILLTGTPLQNNLTELWSLLNFLLPELFGDLDSFESWFDMDYLESEAGREQLVADQQRNDTLGMLHQILGPFMLRRLKNDVELLVPPKREVMVYAPLTAKQRKYYEAAVDKTIESVVQTKQYKLSQKKVKYDEKGRPIRESVNKPRYDLLLDTAGDKFEDVEAWAEAVCKMYAPKKKEVEEIEMTSEINVKLRHILWLLRKSCNHAYLLDYPLTKDGQFKIDEDLIKASGKFLLLDRMLAELKKGGHKVLIFSQMTSMLDLIHDFCYLRDYKFTRLDGSMNVQERKEQMDLFNKEEDVFLFLLSTRAGGLGINLTAADTVIIFDSDWNPQADLQAQDRCHRIGQTKPVLIYRFVTANTIDEKIVERASNKRTLEKMVIHKEKFKKGLHQTGGKVETSAMDTEELLSLLHSSHFDEVAGNQDEVISGKDLRNLLDRSDLYRAWEALKNGKDVQEDKKKSQEEVKGVFKVLNTEMKYGKSVN